jgi:hypothetical protein
MNVGATLTTSFLVTLTAPATWALALSAFLLRGGWIVVVAPIVVIPSAVGLAILIAPLVTSAVFGGGVAALALFLATLGGLGLAWYIVGGLVAAAAEAEMTRLVASDPEVATGLPAAPHPVDGRAASVLAVRFVANLPLALALVWGAGRLVAVAYRELTLPSEVAIPIVIRVVRSSPEVVLIVAAAWLVGGIVGGLAARRVVMADAPIRAALAWAVRRLGRHPLRALALQIVPLLALAAVLVPSIAAASAAWTAVRASFGSGGFVETVVAIIVFVTLWLGGLVLAGVVSAWRGAVWTLDVAGTFGPPVHGRPGGWRRAEGSATLSDLRPGGVDPDTR